jgi:hypothetical protein
MRATMEGYVFAPSARELAAMSDFDLSCLAGIRKGDRVVRWWVRQRAAKLLDMRRRRRLLVAVKAMQEVDAAGRRSEAAMAQLQEAISGFDRRLREIRAERRAS